MKKRYVNGIIIKVEDYITSVNFEQHNMDSNYKIRIYRDLTTNMVNIKYNQGSKTSDLPKHPMFVVEDDSEDIKVVGKIIPQPTLIINGIEYIFSEYDFQSLNIYLIHNLPELNIIESRWGIHNNSLYISILDSELESLKDPDNYVEFINKTGLIYAKVIDKSKFKISNIYSAYFDNKIYEYQDKSIIGQQLEFYVNDVTVTADFIRQMRERHPEIQFYARSEDKDTTKYNEWINYKITPTHLKHGSLYTSHVWQDSLHDRFWKSALDIEFEYTTNDLPTLMTRRDQFKVGKFLNEDRQFSYVINNGIGEDLDIGYTVFWERDILETDYNKNTSQDDLSYAQFTYKYIGRLGYTNLESGYSNRKSMAIESVIYTILYAPNNVSLNKWTSDVILKNTDLNYKEFLIEYLKLSNAFEAEFGVKITLEEPDCMSFEEFDNEVSYERINRELLKLIENLKSIGDSAIKESNFVMVASVGQIKSLIEQYRHNILSKFNSVTDIDTESGDELGDAMTFETSIGLSSNDKLKIEYEEIKNTSDKDKDDNTEDKEEEDISDSEYVPEHMITTDGTYKPADIPNHDDEDEQQPIITPSIPESNIIKQQVSGNSANITIVDDDIIDDNELTLDIDLISKNNCNHFNNTGIIL